MLWRPWTFGSGIPLGVLLAWAVLGASPAPHWLALGGVLGGVSLLLVASLLARRRDDDPARGRHLAIAASGAWAAVPALGAAVLRLEPGATWLAAGIALALVPLFAHAARVRAPAGSPVRPFGRALLALLLGAVGVAAVSLLLASSRGVRALPDEARAAAIYDVDARVATRPLLRCESKPSRVETLLASGARPRAGPEGQHLWFDARTADGSRQVQRLERSTGAVLCWTCAEPGDNVRPSPAPNGSVVVFETSRYASWSDPTNTELQLATARGEEPPPGTRRLTWSPGPDEYPVVAPNSGRVVWSRRVDGRYAVVSGAIRSAHGGVQLAGVGVMTAPGAAWTAPLAWSPDARALVVASGNPFRPAHARGIDLATERRVDLGGDVAGGGAVAFNADGGTVLVAAARRARAAGLLPSAAGLLLGPWATRAASGESLYRGTGIRMGEAWSDGVPLDLGDVADWGEPTGVTLIQGSGSDAPETDRLAFVLGQRRVVAGGDVEERLLEITLACRVAPSEEPRPLSSARAHAPRDPSRTR